MYANSPEERAPIQRYVFAVLGVVAAVVLIGVSMLLNFRFGFQMGRTEVDGYIYGAASVAADALKCLAPFFFFAAIRNRMWSQAAAAAAVGLVVTAYALVGAFGHVAVNRSDTASSRTVAADHYKDLRAEQKRAAEQLSWVPQHRPTATIEAEIASQKTARMFQITSGCAPASVQTSGARTFCSDLHKLEAERASSIEGARLQSRLDEINAKLAPISAAPTSGDPQVDTLSRVTKYAPEHVVFGLALLVVALIEIGSVFGLYMAMSNFPDKPRGKRKVETEFRPANDDVETGSSSTVVPFPTPATAATAADSAVTVSAALGAVAIQTTSEGHQLSEADAKEDLIRRLERGETPNQQTLADTWGVAKSTVSKWLDRWQEFERVGDTKPYQAKTVVRKGTLEAAA